MWNDIDLWVFLIRTRASNLDTDRDEQVPFLPGLHCWPDRIPSGWDEGLHPVSSRQPPTLYAAGTSFTNLVLTYLPDIPIVDAAVAHTIPNGTDTYKPYDVGTTQGVFIRNPDGSEYIGKVWPGYTVFPDYFHPNTTSWWTEMLQDWFDLGIEFDGLWEDMNEVSSFCDGSCGSNLTADQFNKGSSPGLKWTTILSGMSSDLTAYKLTDCGVAAITGTYLVAAAISRSTAPWHASTLMLTMSRSGVLVLRPKASTSAIRRIRKLAYTVM
jgi:hypothetical protein